MQVIRDLTELGESFWFEAVRRISLSRGFGSMGRSEEDGKLVAEVGPANMCTKTCVKLGRTMYVASCEEIGSHFHMYIRE